MQPYQEASNEIKRQNDLPGKALKNVGALGLSFAGGGALLSRILPFLNSIIPAAIAKKGLEKIEPRFGNFFNIAQNNGYSDDDALEFVRQKAQEMNPNAKKEPPQQMGGPTGRDQQPIKPGGIVEMLTKGMQQPQQQVAPQQQAPSQSGNADQALLAALDKILKM